MPDEKPDTQTPAAPAAPAAATFDTLIPEEFKDRPYLTDLKTLPVGPDSYKVLFKKLDGAQTLIGKRTGIPAADAPAEEWEKFHAALRPAKADDYEIPAKEGYTPDPEVQKSMKAIFHEAGLSKSQASTLMAKFEAFATEKMGAQAAENAKLDAEFTEMTKTAFGAENEKVIARSKELLTTLTPPQMAPFLNRLPNESLALIAGIMENVRAKFMKEDNLGPGGGDGGAPVDEAALRKEARDLQASPVFRDTFHADHAALKAKVDGIYARIAAARGKK